MQFNQYIRHLRKKNKLTQLELAKKSGVSKTHISRIELVPDAIPKPDTLKKLAPSLGVTPEHLMYMAGHYKDTTEHEFIEQLDLDDEELMKRFKFMYEGRALSEFEIKWILSFLRTHRHNEKF